MLRQILQIGLAIASLSATSVYAQNAESSGDNAERARQMFARADQDKDGTLSLSEWKAIGRREEGFKFIDADKNGKVTPAEIRAAVAAYRQSR
ncbi:EF-hand domain-containing protein [Sphingomonas sp. AP4-R1]|uniref:EF-hand domain-containing protein n=1 Tax=Sphingomonas sp. AP4-R1 TaxID=2735134 RepID=UPI00149395FE|nr:EF-hand domain-containing protein [Sphingomonas sp. AP4-R1]QJU58242.1 EF-hand domain-containing protein [Sphingomonas sp. AP4-R1]